MWKGNFPTREPSLEEAAEGYGRLGTFVPAKNLILHTVSTGSCQSPIPPVEPRQRAAEGNCGRSLGEETETTGKKVIELFGLTELVDNLELELKLMVFCTKKTVIVLLCTGRAPDVFSAQHQEKSGGTAGHLFWVCTSYGHVSVQK